MGVRWRALSGGLGFGPHRIGPGRAQYTHLLDPDDASVLDDIIVWWVDDERFDVMPNASNTDRVTGALGESAVDVTTSRAVLAVQGPKARERVAAVVPEAAAVPRFVHVSSRAIGELVTPAGERHVLAGAKHETAAGLLAWAEREILKHRAGGAA